MEAKIPPIKPINDTLLVKGDPCKEKVGKEGILYAPQGAEVWPNTGTVISVGPGTWEKHNGELVRVPLEGAPGVPLKPGDRILFKRQPASAIVPDDRDGDPNDWKLYVMLDYVNVLGLIEEE